MNTNPPSIHTITDLVIYWRNCFDDLPKDANALRQRDVAYHMVNIISLNNGLWEEYYLGKKTDKVFRELYDIVTNLEMTQKTRLENADDWKRVGVLISTLEDTYLKT